MNQLTICIATVIFLIPAFTNAIYGDVPTKPPKTREILDGQSQRQRDRGRERANRDGLADLPTFYNPFLSFDAQTTRRPVVVRTGKRKPTGSLYSRNRSANSRRTTPSPAESSRNTDEDYEEKVRILSFGLEPAYEDSANEKSRRLSFGMQSANEENSTLLGVGMEPADAQGIVRSLGRGMKPAFGSGIASVLGRGMEGVSGQSIPRSHSANDAERRTGVNSRYESRSSFKDNGDWRHRENVKPQETDQRQPVGSQRDQFEAQETRWSPVNRYYTSENSRWQPIDLHQPDPPTFAEDDNIDSHTDPHMPNFPDNTLNDTSCEPLPEPDLVEPDKSWQPTYDGNGFRSPDPYDRDYAPAIEATPRRPTCPSPTATGAYPYEPDCQKFLNCWKGQGYIQSCAPGTLFNPKSNECDYPHKVTCLGKTVPKIEMPQPSFVRVAVRGAKPPKPTRAPRRQRMCPEPTGLFPHPEDCSKFFNCWSGRAFVQDCAPGTLFNPLLGNCDHPYNVRCSSEEEKGRSLDTEEEYEEAEEAKGVKIVSAPPTPPNGQTLRLRGGSGPWEGFLEAMDSEQKSLGLVCDEGNGWTMEEAHVVCRQLGFERGAELMWQGADFDGSSSFLSVVESVRCSGSESKLSYCDVRYGNSCRVDSDLVGVRCHRNRASFCNPGETPFNGRCYGVHEEPLSYEPAFEACRAEGSQLVDVNSQAENDFISELLLHQYPNISEVLTGGVGLSVFHRSLWVWESTEAPFEYSKWWPGWHSNIPAEPQTGSSPICILLRREFPCWNQKCNADYFFWDVNNCKQEGPYICEREYNDIGCITGDGKDYRGMANVTSSGKVCLPWGSAIDPVVLGPSRKNKMYDHNYCRNMDNDRQPWCFVDEGRYEFCDIPQCTNREFERSLMNFGTRCGSNHFQCAVGECIPLIWVCDGEKDCPNGLDENSCKGFLKEFSKKSSHRLEDHGVEKWLHTTAKTCSKRCVEAKYFICRAFSYNVEERLCLLSDSNEGLSGAVTRVAGWDYYEMKSRALNCGEMFRCDNRKCINTTAVCNGKNDCGDRSDERNCSVENLGYEIRLAGGNTSYEGRVEIKAYGKWGVICDDLFGLQDATVVCHELGFSMGAMEAVSHSFFGGGNGLFLMDGVQCLGNETSIRECEFEGWGKNDCGPEEVAGVVCRVPGLECADNHWQCDNKACILIDYLCDNREDCEDGSDEDPRRCNSTLEVRLVDGTSEMEGRVEIRYLGHWGTICDDDFGASNAQVICRMLGYAGPAQAMKEAYYGAGNGQIWLDELHCGGAERSIEQCTKHGWGKHNCKHNEDASVRCSRSNTSSQRSPAIGNFPDRPPVSDNLILQGSCGIRFVDDDPFYPVLRMPKMYGGKETRKGAHPWQASLRVKAGPKSIHWCGAVIISTLHVITAAHCLRYFNKDTYLVRVGDYDTEEYDGTEQEFNIDEIYIHEEFNRYLYLNNDIAVVKLKTGADGPIRMGTAVQPACLPSPETEYTPGKNCTVCRWGTVENQESGHTQRLRAGWIPILPMETCTASFVYGSSSLSPGMFCAGFLEGGVDTCKGDSGGPMMCSENNRFVLFGITSWGHGCGRANKPGVYTRVAHYRKWISKTVERSMRGEY